MKRRLRPIRLFVSYSHLDKDWFRKLEPLLQFRDPTQTVYVWHDQELKAGDRWDDEIRDELEKMDVFLCLLSYHFLASPYIREVEVTTAFAREKKQQTAIVPLLISDMADADIVEYRPYHPLPAWGHSWRSYEMNGGHTMDAHKPIRTGLLGVIEKTKNRLAAGATR